jgi:hypothetical protein
MTTFQIGQTYTTRSICDHNATFSITVKARTPAFIRTETGKFLRIKLVDGIETVMPEGRYSMAPVIKAA